MNQVLEFYQQYIGKKVPYTKGITPFLNGTLKELTETNMSIEYEVSEDMINPGGFLHGGIQVTMMDETIGYLVNLLSDDGFYVSINMTADFLGKAKCGDLVTARSNLIRQGKNIANLEGTLINQDGDLIAKSTANLIRINAPSHGESQK